MRRVADWRRELGVETIMHTVGPSIAGSRHVTADDAKNLGVFGAPSFIVDGEVFSGDDRLDDAVSWSRNARVV